MISWVMWSPKRFGVIVVALVLFLGFLAMPSESSEPTTEDLTADEERKNYEEEILNRYRDAESTFTPEPLPTFGPEYIPSPEATPTPEPDILFGTEEEIDTADPLALTAATTFVEKWLDTDDPNWPDVSDVALPGLVDALATTDPANVPEGEVRDANPIFIGTSEHRIEVSISEDTSVLVYVTREPTQWLVRSIDSL